MKKWLLSLFFIIGTGFLNIFNASAFTYTGTVSLSGVTFNTGFSLTSTSSSITGQYLSCFTRLTAPLAIIARFISLDTYSTTTGGTLVFRITQSGSNTQTLTSASTINYVCSDSFGNTGATGATGPQGATGGVTIINNFTGVSNPVNNFTGVVSLSGFTNIVDYGSGIYISGTSVGDSSGSVLRYVDSGVLVGDMIPLLVSDNSGNTYISQEGFLILLRTVFLYFLLAFTLIILVKKAFSYYQSNWSPTRSLFNGKK